MRDQLVSKKLWTVTLLAILTVAILGTALLYINNIRHQLWFALSAPDAVNSCLVGYETELAEAGKRFELRQHGSLINPIVEDGSELLGKD